MLYKAIADEAISKAIDKKVEPMVHVFAVLCGIRRFSDLYRNTKTFKDYSLKMQPMVKELYLARERLSALNNKLKTYIKA